MNRTARFFGGVLFLAAILAVPTLIFLNYQKSRHSRAQLELRLAQLESKLAQEVAIRQTLLTQELPSVSEKSGRPSGGAEPAPAARAFHPPVSESDRERQMRRELEKRDAQIAYLRSVVEKMAFQNPAPAAGSPQVAVEAMPMMPPSVSKSSVSPAGRINQILGEITQISPADGLMFINRGQRHGVTPGMIFEVYRQGQPIGSVRVGTAYDAVSSIAVLEVSDSIRLGDMIRSA